RVHGRVLSRGLHGDGDGGRAVSVRGVRDRGAAPSPQGRDRVARRPEHVRARRDPLRVGYAVLAAAEPVVEEPVVLRRREHLRLRNRDRAQDLHERAREADVTETADVVVIGAGVSGLGFANWWRERHPAARVVVLEAADEPGGYCRTVVRDGFVWDYSGHFFHFKDPTIEAWLRERMPGEEVRTMERVAKLRYAGRDIDFPFQKHIHQLPLDEFLECLVDLHFRPSGEPASFGEMLYARLGKAITDKFLRPYNEKLYAIDLD